MHKESMSLYVYESICYYSSLWMLQASAIKLSIVPKRSVEISISIDKLCMKTFYGKVFEPYWV